MGGLIKQINFPADLRKFKKEDLRQISDELIRTIEFILERKF